VLLAGNAGLDIAADHSVVIQQALRQLPFRTSGCVGHKGHCCVRGWVQRLSCLVDEHPLAVSPRRSRPRRSPGFGFRRR
jgi:hypothetical protein